MIGSDDAVEKTIKKQNWKEMTLTTEKCLLK